MTRAQLTRWLAAYGQAWETRDPEAAARLFSDDVEYHETPFDPPARGRSGVVEYWANATGNQSDVHFSSEVLGVEGNVGMVGWRASFRRLSTGAHVKLDGVLLLHFDDDGLCVRLREWWHRRET